MIEALVWGFCFSFGLFQEYYSSHEPFASEPSGIAIIGTSATGIMYMSALFLMPVYIRWPGLRRRSTYIGLPIMVTALVLASLANSVWHLILTQGVMYAVGGSFLYYPTILFLDEWFVRRKGFAFGLMWVRTSPSPTSDDASDIYQGWNGSRRCLHSVRDDRHPGEIWVPHDAERMGDYRCGPHRALTCFRQAAIAHRSYRSAEAHGPYVHSIAFVPVPGAVRHRAEPRLLPSQHLPAQHKPIVGSKPHRQRLDRHLHQLRRIFRQHGDRDSH